MFILIGLKKNTLDLEYTTKVAILINFQKFI